MNGNLSGIISVRQMFTAYIVFKYGVYRKDFVFINAYKLRTLNDKCSRFVSNRAS